MYICIKNQQTQIKKNVLAVWFEFLCRFLQTCQHFWYMTHGYIITYKLSTQGFDHTLRLLSFGHSYTTVECCACFLLGCDAHDVCPCIYRTICRTDVHKHFIWLKRGKHYPQHYQGCVLIRSCIFLVLYINTNLRRQHCNSSTYFHSIL